MMMRCAIYVDKNASNRFRRRFSKVQLAFQQWLTLSKAWRRLSCRKHWMKASSASSLYLPSLRAHITVNAAPVLYTQSKQHQNTPVQQLQLWLQQLLLLLYTAHITVNAAAVLYTQQTASKHSYNIIQYNTTYIQKLGNHLTLPSSYVHMFQPELNALQHPNFSKFHAPTSSLARALFLYLLPLSGTHFLTALGSVNLCQLFGNTLKLFISNQHFLAPPSDHHPSTSDSIFDFWHFINSFTYLLTYLQENSCITHSGRLLSRV